MTKKSAAAAEAAKQTLYRVTFIGPNNTLQTRDVFADDVGYDAAHGLAFLRKNGTEMVKTQKREGEGDDAKMVDVEEEVEKVEAFLTFKAYVSFEIVDQSTIQ